jgi:hypothetical protein
MLEERSGTKETVADNEQLSFDANRGRRRAWPAPL